MNGTRLAAMFAFGPNCLDYCGSKKDSEKIYLHASAGKGNENEMREIFSRFTGMNSYLELIAGENGKNPFDYEVVEAYWLGNKLLKNVSKEKWREMILTKFVSKEGLSKAQAKAYAQRVRGEVVPHHSFHVMTVFTLGGKPEPTIRNIDSCRIPWGKIIEERENSFVVEYNPLALEKNGFGFGKNAGIEVLNSVPGLGGKLVLASEGDTIAFHWGFAAKKLGESERKSLEKCTSENIGALNAQSLR
ncbi:MAG: DUF6390 family protein [archaeon]